MKKILFICMGNICRSPTAEAVFSQWVKGKGMANSYYLDSAGTHSYHVGSQPDKRSMQAAKKRGIDMSHLRARQVCADDFDQFDYLVVMDDDNKCNLESMFPMKSQDKVVSMMQFADNHDYDEVPDPYYGEGDGFELVLDLLEQASTGLFEFLTENQNTSV
ncbi:MAG: low molecular weight protein-tyrosine-phosphatase [Marinicella sp.]